MLRHRILLAALVVAAVGLICIAQAAPPGGADPGRGGDRPGRGNFDPNQFRQRMMDRMKETLGATDEEMKALAPRIEKVQTLQRDARGGGGMGGMFGRGGRGGPGGGGPGGTAAPEPTTDVGKTSQALSKVLENKEAKADDIKLALQAYRDARAKAEAALEQAQKELREVLTVRQEAQFVMMGLLK
jgi:hypothetical protein